eukprot:jgi/Botrbrau1/9352/Bobra.354_2s0010.1
MFHAGFAGVDLIMAASGGMSSEECVSEASFIAVPGLDGAVGGRCQVLEACRRDEIARDVVVHVNGQPLLLHSQVLGYYSDFFNAAFSNTCSFVEARKKMMDLQLDPVAASAWPLLLRYMYQNVIELSDQNVLPLLVLSRQLIIPGLEKYCRDYVIGRLHPENCLEMLYDVIQCADMDLQSVCTKMAAENFAVTCTLSPAGLPPEVVLDILQHP